MFLKFRNLEQVLVLAVRQLMLALSTHSVNEAFWGDKKRRKRKSFGDMHMI